MAHYTLPIGTDAEIAVRKFYLDGAGVPTAGLVVAYVFRDVAGNTLQSGSLAEVNAALAPGWYKLPSAQALNAGGAYTVEYAPPVGFAPDADTIFVTTDAGRTTTEFVRGG